MEQQNKPPEVPASSFIQRLLSSLLRTFFKLLYHQLAWTYDWVASLVSLGGWQKWVLSATHYLAGPRTLEIGFGPGHLQAALQQNGITAFGLDESTQMGHITHRRLIGMGLQPNLVRGYAQNLPFADGSFDQLVMTFPAEFIITQSTFSEIHRVLIQGGLVVIIPMAWITGNKPMERAAAWLNHITGEASVWDEKHLDPLKTMGFDVDWEMLSFASSKLLLIRLVKNTYITAGIDSNLA
jgi:SAM-dependent methyltransferase